MVAHLCCNDAIAIIRGSGVITLHDVPGLLHAVSVGLQRHRGGKKYRALMVLRTLAVMSTEWRKHASVNSSHVASTIDDQPTSLGLCYLGRA